MAAFDPTPSPSEDPTVIFRVEQEKPGSQSLSNNRPRWGAFFLKMLAIFGMIGLVLGPLVVLEFPKEVSRWYLAAAVEKQQTGEQSAAYALLEQGIAWAPNSYELVFQRAQWKLAENLPQEALEDCHQILQLQPKLAEGFFFRSMVHQRLGDHVAALQDLDQLVDIANDDYYPIDVALNARAYGRALAIDDKKLDIAHVKEALEDVEQALKSKRFNAAYLDTRGFLYFLQGDNEPALTDLNQAVELSEQEFEALVSAAEQASLEKFVFEKIKQDGEQHLAVIYHHRHRIFEKLGKQQMSKSDHQRALKLGYNPAEGVR